MNAVNPVGSSAVDSVDAFLDGPVDRRVSHGYNLRHSGGFTATPLAEVFGLLCENVSRIRCIWVQHTLKYQMK